MFAFLRRSRLCECGHKRAAHKHYRAGSDCGACTCGRFRRGRVNAVRTTEISKTRPSKTTAA